MAKKTVSGKSKKSKYKSPKSKELSEKQLDHVAGGDKQGYCGKGNYPAGACNDGGRPWY